MPSYSVRRDPPKRKHLPLSLLTWNLARVGIRLRTFGAEELISSGFGGPANIHADWAMAGRGTQALWSRPEPRGDPGALFDIYPSPPPTLR